MEMHKMTIYIIDPNEDMKTDEMKILIENALKNQIVHIGKEIGTDIGDWSDDHRLNQLNSTTEEHEDYFK